MFISYYLANVEPQGVEYFLCELARTDKNVLSVFIGQFDGAQLGLTELLVEKVKSDSIQP